MLLIENKLARVKIYLYLGGKRHLPDLCKRFSVKKLLIELTELSNDAGLKKKD